MRIIAGRARGLKLSAPAGMQTRPTSDRVKEALFSILASRFAISDVSVLDLCAGTGALGIESISRGASFCCFVESDRSVCAVLEKNLMTAGFRCVSEILRADLNLALSKIIQRSSTFDLIFFDPPYKSGLYDSVLQKIATTNILARSGVLIVESSAKMQLTAVEGLKSIVRKVYGDTALEFYMRGEG